MEPHPPRPVSSLLASGDPCFRRLLNLSTNQPPKPTELASEPRTKRPPKWLVALLGLLALLVAHEMALLYRIQPAVSLWFPPAGVATLLTLWLGPFGAGLTAIASIIMAPLWGSSGWMRWVGLVDAVEPLVAWFLYRYCWHGSLALASAKDVVRFILSGPVAASGSLAGLGSLALMHLGLISQVNLGQTIAHWWLGNAIGMMAIVPTVLLMAHWSNPQGTTAKSARPIGRLAAAWQRSWLEISLIVALMLSLAALTVAQADSAGLGFQQLSFLSFLPIVWAAVRFGALGGMLTASASVLVTLFYYLLFYRGTQVAASFPIDSTVLHVHKLSLLVQTGVALLLGTAVTEKAATQARLVTEQVQRQEADKRADLAAQLVQLNQSLSVANQRLLATNQELQSSEARFRASLESMLDCFGIYSAIRNGAGEIEDFRIEYVNDAACITNLMTREAHLGQRLCELLPAHRASGLFAEYCQVVETGKPLTKDAILYEDNFGEDRLNQHRIARTFNIRVAQFEDGIVATWRDVTAIKQAEADLYRSQARFRRMIDSNIIGVFYSNLSGQITDANDAFLAMLGYSRAELVAGQIVWSRLLPRFAQSVDQPDKRREVLVEALEERDPELPEERSVVELMQQGVFAPRERELVRQDGSRVWTQIAGAMIADSDEAVCYVLNLTERKQIEAERNQILRREQAARQQAETASRMKDEFLAIVSHELRSPLNAILGWSRLLRSQKLDAEKTERALEVVERNAQAQTQLIEDLLDISRIIRGQVRLHLCPVGLGTVIQAAVEAIRPAAAAKQIQLEVAVEAISLAADPDRLQQVVWNLLSNAVKFTPEGGQITVRTTRLPAQQLAQLTVSDTGRGIAADFLPYVFERFRQEDSSTSRTQGGLGLGLSIVRHLVELHGGTVEVMSAGEGQGATFSVKLPLPASAPTELTVAPPRPTSVPPGLHVLVVDDEPDTREFLQVVLENAGARVTAVDSVEAALAQFRQQPPDLLLSDIAMPEADGYSLIQTIRALPPEQGGRVPAAALTAFARESDRAKAIAAGFQMHVPKPLDPDQLLRVVAELAGRSQP